MVTYVPELRLSRGFAYMDPQEFEVRYREQVSDILNRLQTAVGVAAQLETTIADIGNAVQRLSREVEQFLGDQRTDPRDSGLS